MASLPAPPTVQAILASLVEEHTGLHYGAESRALFIDKVSARAVDAGFESLLDYYYFLRYDPHGGAELEALTEALVVNETYFFREADPLAVVLRAIEPLAVPGARPRIWCAAAATGEEPLTVAMLLADRGLLDRVELIASDISLRALGRAQAGEFGRRSLRHTPPPPLAARFLTERDGKLHVAPELREAIQWRRINLTDEKSVGAVGPCDLILCRNVLIYFNDDRARRVVEGLAAALRPGGVLLVGVSESLLRLGTTLVCEERDGVFLYRKAASR